MSKNLRHEKGREAEGLVADYFLKKKFELLARRLRTPYAEVDLVFRGPIGELLLVEVKSQPNSDFLAISSGQIERLRRAMLWFMQKNLGEVRCAIALVGRRGDIEVVDDFLG